MALINRFPLNNMVVNSPKSPIIESKELLQEPEVIKSTQTTSGVQKGNENNTIPDELKELLAKYQEEGCTKEEILNVLEKLGIQYKENGNKIDFEYNGKSYSLSYTEPEPVESSESTTTNVTSDEDNAAFVQEFDEFINDINAEIDNFYNEIDGLMEIAMANYLTVDFSSYEAQIQTLLLRLEAKGVEYEKNHSDKLTDEMKSLLQECKNRISTASKDRILGLLPTINEYKHLLKDNIVIHSFDTQYDWGLLYDEEPKTEIPQKTDEPDSIEIAFPDVENMSLDEINEMLPKKEATLNAVKEQIELLDKKGANQQGGNVAIQMLKELREKYQNVMMQLIDVVNALQTQKAMLEVQAEIDAESESPVTTFGRDENGNITTLSTAYTDKDGNVVGTTELQLPNAYIGSMRFNENNADVRYNDDGTVTVHLTRTSSIDYRNPEDNELNITYKDKDGNVIGNLKHNFYNVIAGKTLEIDIKYNTDGTVEYINEYIYDKEYGPMNYRYYYDKEGNITKIECLGGGKDEPKTIEGDLAKFINENSNNSVLSDEKADELRKLLINKPNGSEPKGYSCTKSIIYFYVGGAKFLYKVGNW